MSTFDYLKDSDKDKMIGIKLWKVQLY